MTLAANPTKLAYPGPGGTIFVFPYAVQSASNLLLRKTDFATGYPIGSPLLLNTDYTVAGAGVGSNSVTVTLTSDLGSYGLLIQQIVPITQDVGLANEGVFQPKSIEAEFDKLTQIALQLQDQVSRAPVAPANTNPDPLSTPVEGGVLGWVTGKFVWLTTATTTLAASLLSSAVGLGASLITVMKSATGVVATTLQEIMDRNTNILDFMTLSQKLDVLSHTGALNVSAAMIAAVASVSAHGGVIIMPAGKYNFGNQIVMPDSPITIKGKGAYTTTKGTAIVWSGAASTAIFKTADYSCFEGMYIDGNGVSSVTAFDVVGTTAPRYVTHQVYRNVIVKSCAFAWDVDFAWINSWYDCNALTCGIGWNIGKTTGDVNSCQWTNCHGVACGYGVYNNSINRTLVWNGCSFEQCTVVGIDLYGGGTGFPIAWQFNGTYFEANAQSIRMLAGTAEFTSTYINNDGATNGCIKLGSVAGASFRGLYFINVASGKEFVWDAGITGANKRSIVISQLTPKSALRVALQADMTPINSGVIDINNSDLAVFETPYITTATYTPYFFALGDILNDGYTVCAAFLIAQTGGVTGTNFTIQFGNNPSYTNIINQNLGASVAAGKTQLTLVGAAVNIRPGTFNYAFGNSGLATGSYKIQLLCSKE